MKLFGMEGPPGFDGSFVATPVGRDCEYCDELFVEGDRGLLLPPGDLAFHVECFLRTVFGSVGHQRNECSCHGKLDTSEDNMSARDAARRATAYFYLVRSGPPGTETVH